MPSAKRRAPLLLVAALALPPVQVVDSIFTPEVELARFRASLPGTAPTALSGGASSRVELIRRFVTAVETNDTLALNRLLLSKAEFAYFYFPASEYSRPPYRQKPGLVWFRMTESSQKGIGRVLARDGGKPLAATGHRCPTLGKPAGLIRLWNECRLFVRQDGRTIERHLFGSIIERNGAYKFLTYASDY